MQMLGNRAEAIKKAVKKAGGDVTKLGNKGT